MPVWKYWHFYHTPVHSGFDYTEIKIYYSFVETSLSQNSWVHFINCTYLIVWHTLHTCTYIQSYTCIVVDIHICTLFFSVLFWHIYYFYWWFMVFLVVYISNSRFVCHRADLVLQNQVHLKFKIYTMLFGSQGCHINCIKQIVCFYVYK